MTSSFNGHTNVRIKRRRASHWTARNPVLGNGEPGFEIDTGYIKIGNGVSRWTELPYLSTGINGSSLQALLDQKVNVEDTVQQPSMIPTTGVPVANYGENGDLAIDWTTIPGSAVIYGPKNSANTPAWPATPLTTIGTGIQPRGLHSPGGAYTLVLTDASQILRMISNSNVSLTIPANSSVAFPVGTEIPFIQAGTGLITVAKASGVTLRTLNNVNPLVTAYQWQRGWLLKVATDEWVASLSTG